ncbi:MAG: hypothetical protein GKR89_24260 [Candidatus Latescibacteria bacterium]|nr:hypothetical protein [Candidatus Latescibacterota bacterium]
MSQPEKPTPEEIAFFHDNGYLVLEDCLTPDHVAQLLQVLEKAVARRRHLNDSGQPYRGITNIDGDNIRILHILEDDPLLLDLLDYPPVMPYIHTLLSEKAHFHASDAFWETEPQPSQPGWHIDGYDGGYRTLRPNIPLLQLKLGYFLSDMSQPDQANLTLVPGSHRLNEDLTEAQRQSFAFAGAMQLCVPPGAGALFHNALWHTRGPFTRAGGQRKMLYYAYELPWMVGNPEHWSYTPDFYSGLSEEHRAFFHGFAFEPKQERWF